MELSSTIEWPFLVLHGEADKLTYIGGSRLLEKNAKSQDKEIKVGQFLHFNCWVLYGFTCLVAVACNFVSFAYSSKEYKYQYN